MPIVGAMIDFEADTLIASADVDQNFADLRNAINNSAVLVDVAREITVAHTFVAGFLTDTITERTLGAGVTIDGVLLKDGGVSVDLISERTAASGVVVDGVALKDGGVTATGAIVAAGGVSVNTISERTAASGVTVDGVLLKDGGATLSGALTVTGAASLASTLALSRGSAVSDTLQLTSTTFGTGLVIGGDANLYRGAANRLSTDDDLHLVAGKLLIGTTLATGAGVGEVILANAKAIRGVTAAGTLTTPLVSLNTSNHAQLGSNSVAVAVGDVTATTGVQPGDLLMGNAKVIRGVNAAGTAAQPLLYLDGSNNTVVAGPGGSSPLVLSGFYSDTSAMGAYARRILVQVAGVNYYIALHS